MTIRRDTRWNRLLALAPGLTFIAAWIALLEVAARSGWTNRAFSPVPSEVGGRLWNVLVSPALLDAVGATVSLLAAGYLLACVAGVLCGLVMGYSRTVYALLEPTLELVRPIPKPALLPPLILLLGLGAPMKIAIVFLGALFPVLINTIQGVRTVDLVLVNVARTFRLGALRTMFTVMLPASLPMILAGMRVSLGLGFILVVLAEMLTGSHGLGAQLVDAQRAFRVHEMYAWTVVLALVGLALALGFDALERQLIFWSSRR